MVGGMGILLITAVVEDSSELPLGQVYVRSVAGDAPLKLVAAALSVVPDEAPIRSVGRFRLDSYYLMPVVMIDRPGSLMIDFARNRTGFEVVALPLDPPDYAVPAGEASKPDPAAIRDFLTREFPDAPPITGKE